MNKKHLLLYTIYVTICILISTSGKAQSVKREDSILGSWKNCGSYNLNSNTIVLYRQWTDTCDTYGDCCNQSIWEFSKAGDLNPELGNFLHIELTASCKTKIKLACSASKTLMKWNMDAEEKNLIIEYGKQKIHFEIKSLDKTHLYLIKH